MIEPLCIEPTLPLAEIRALRFQLPPRCRLQSAEDPLDDGHNALREPINTSPRRHRPVAALLLEKLKDR